MPKRDSLSLYEPKLQCDAVSIVSVPSELGSDARGLARTPEHLLGHGLKKKIESLGIAVATSDVSCPAPKGVELGSRIKNLEEIVQVSEASCRQVHAAASQGAFVLSLGGDHSIAIGTIAGASLAHESLGLIWIDAHPDANTEESTMTGNIHGMPVSALMGFGNAELASVGGAQPKILPEHMLYIGLKDLDQPEINFIRERQIAACTMHDIAARALQPVFDAIDALSSKANRIWVSMDIDSIDELYSPGVAMNSMGGLTRREAVAIANYIGKTCRLAGMDMVEIVPEKDRDGQTIKLVFELVANFLGMNDGSYTEYMRKYTFAGNSAEILVPSARTRA